MYKNTRHDLIFKFVWLSVLSALIVVFQTVLAAIKIGPVSISFVLIPIVVGGLVIGPYAGLFLGFLFGIINIINGVTGVDGFTLVLLEEAPFWTVLICLLKSSLAGFIPPIIYNKMQNKKLGVFIAAALAPIINTGIFCFGSLLFLADPVSIALGGNYEITYALFILCAGWNFIAEFVFNTLLSPAIFNIVKTIKKD